MTDRCSSIPAQKPVVKKLKVYACEEAIGTPLSLIDVSPIQHNFEGRKSSVPSLEGKNQVGERKEQSAYHRVVLRCRVGSPKVTNLEDAEGQGRSAIVMTKGRIAEWFGEPDLLRRVTLRSTFLVTINTFLNI
uniref:Uncharacterized protein n=1 Tax=Solanum tuberosum TaxID=4113 RepID=M1DQM7_SOLTU